VSPQKPIKRKSPISVESLVKESKSWTKLGEGGYGIVYAAPFEGQTYAIKITKNDPDGSLPENLIREISVLSQVSSPYLVNLHTFEILADGSYFVLECCQHNLQYVLDHLKDEVPTIIRYTTQILMGLSYLHQMGIIHGDIKPDNYLICNGTLKLTDYGLSQRILPPYTFIQQDVYSSDYCPVEHILGNAPIRPSSDLWAMGCVIVAMIIGHSPFSYNHDPLIPIFKKLGIPPKEIFETYGYPSISTYQYKRKPLCPSVDTWLDYIIAHSLVYDPNLRIPAKILLTMKNSS
jgi:serine/threonine protein kinase